MKVRNDPRPDTFGVFSGMSISITTRPATEHNAEKRETCCHICHPVASSGSSKIKK